MLTVLVAERAGGRRHGFDMVGDRVETVDVAMTVEDHRLWPCKETRDDVGGILQHQEAPLELAGRAEAPTPRCWQDGLHRLIGDGEMMVPRITSSATQHSLAL